MDQQQIMKAEVLLTRRCNLTCKTCALIKQQKPELSLDEWKKAFDIIYTDLGGDFIALYGGEPLMLKDKLVEIVRHLAKHRKNGKDFTVISNSVGLTKPFMQKLMKAGLQSWTASVDGFADGAYYDKNSWKKSSTGYTKLLEFREMGLRDCCGIFTITKKNILQLPKVIKTLSGDGIWTGFDFIHYDKGNDCVGHSRFNATRQEIGEDVLLDIDEDGDTVRRIMGEVSDLKRAGYMVFPSFEAIEKLAHPEISVGLGWNCKYPASITLDCDGTLGCCDDYPGKNVEKWSIFDLAGRNRWEEFTEIYKKDVEKCYNCAWSTHILACQFVDEAGNLLSEKARDYYQHKACAKDF
jgi:MoaA/NifB/PqqE/SkfB family radical SAM enzyme